MSRCPPATSVRRRTVVVLAAEDTAGIVTATMTAVPDPPMRLAYLGDPNEVHTRRWLTFFVARGHEVPPARAERPGTRVAAPRRHRARADGPVRHPLVSTPVPTLPRGGPSAGCSIGSMPKYSASVPDRVWLLGLAVGVAAVRDHGLGLGRVPDAADLAPAPPLWTAESARRRSGDRGLGRPGRRGDRRRRAPGPDERGAVRRRHRPLQPDARQRVAAPADRPPDESAWSSRLGSSSRGTDTRTSSARSPRCRTMSGYC